MPKRFVLSGYFGFKNFGDEAILSVIIEHLKQHNHRVLVISSDPVYTKSKYKHIRSVYTFNFPDIIGAISKSDILISGGGSLLQDATSLKSLLYYLFIIFIALFLRKKVIIFAQGIGPIKSTLGQFLTKNIIKHASYISVRDKKSMELLKEWNIDSDLLCDPVFSKKIKNHTKKRVVAVQLRDYMTLTEDFIDILAQKTVTEFKNYDVNIYSLQDTMDLEVCKKFERAINLLDPNIKTCVYKSLTDEQIIKGISEAEFLIAMRFHAIIIGILARCKTLCINYDIKVERIAAEFNLPLIEMNRNIENQFEELKKINIDNINALTKEHNFNWSSFDGLLNK